MGKSRSFCLEVYFYADLLCHISIFYYFCRIKVPSYYEKTSFAAS